MPYHVQQGHFTHLKCPSSILDAHNKFRKPTRLITPDIYIILGITIAVETARERGKHWKRLLRNEGNIYLW
jgi:hypothetical protein